MSNEAMMAIGAVFLVLGVVASLTVLFCFVGVPLAIVGLGLLLGGAVMEPSASTVVYAPGYPVAPAAPLGAPCPECATPLQWVAQHGRWFCPRCNRYR